MAFTNPRYMKLTAIIFILVFLLFIKPVSASGNPNWASENKTELQSAFKEKNCDKIWAVVWPEFKTGEPSAINFLLMLVSPMTDMDMLRIPHIVQRNDWPFRDQVQLTIHALKIRDIGEEVWPNNEWADETLFKALENNQRAPNFLKCLKEKGEVRCNEIAIKDNVVPSFAEYIKEVDQAIANGKRPICEFVPESAVDISGTGGIKK